MGHVVLCAVERWAIGCFGLALGLTTIYTTLAAIANMWRIFVRTSIGEVLMRPRYVRTPAWADWMVTNGFPFITAACFVAMLSVALHSLGRLITDAMGWCHFAR